MANNDVDGGAPADLSARGEGYPSDLRDRAPAAAEWSSTPSPGSDENWPLATEFENLAETVACLVTLTPSSLPSDGLPGHIRS